MPPSRINRYRPPLRALPGGGDEQSESETAVLAQPPTDENEAAPENPMRPPLPGSRLTVSAREAYNDSRGTVQPPPADPYLEQLLERAHTPQQTSADAGPAKETPDEDGHREPPSDGVSVDGEDPLLEQLRNPPSQPPASAPVALSSADLPLTSPRTSRRDRGASRSRARETRGIGAILSRRTRISRSRARKPRPAAASRQPNARRRRLPTATLVIALAAAVGLCAVLIMRAGSVTASHRLAGAHASGNAATGALIALASRSTAAGDQLASYLTAAERAEAKTKARAHRSAERRSRRQRARAAARRHHRAAHHSSHIVIATAPARTTEQTTTSAPYSSAPTSATGSAGSSASSGNSSSVAHKSTTSSHQPAFGANGSLGPGASPDS